MHLERLACEMVLVALVLKVSVAGITLFVLSNGGAELNPLSVISLPYCLESFLAIGGAIVCVSVFVNNKAQRLILYSFILSLTLFDLAWDVTQAFNLPIYEGIVDAAFITAAIPTFTALHIQQNHDIYGNGPG
ncbi:MAG: hypothetical protein ABSA72_09585 [Nitrososphaerales archaeon]|jgi:hypothetical protein